MASILDQPTVLVLNRNWQAVNVRTPADAFCQMMTNAAVGLDINADKSLRPVRWEDWLALPIREQDRAVGTSRGPIRVPTVVVLGRYDKVPRRRPKLSPRSIRVRDGNRCQYTGRVLAPGEGSVDHVVPRSRGGPTSWENCVWTSKVLNGQKADRLPTEANLRLLAAPRQPPELPVTLFIRNAHGVVDWDIFLPLDK
jgi:5-methylcytosine-specific restriction endonuclease McrA